ncbi:hypothetical protein FBU59_000408 [Linderina macrospora]|uniref:Uncharacterized protein n=1 Tax=Linderina macrospora TaxID=4868 RepID=A0ACC1JH74_9FUNG|nr:hypothetical protein FBU59_000408 [Linderina macrospora]
MKPVVVVYVFCAACSAWTMKDKFATYVIAQKLAKFPTNSILERDMYTKLAIFFNDWHIADNLNTDFKSSDYREALNKLKSLIDIQRSEAAQLDTTGVMTLDYITNRITDSYKASVRSTLDLRE